MALDEQNDAFAGDADERKEKASAPILSALKRAEDEFRDWQTTCHDIDDIYSLHGAGYGGIRGELDSYGWQDTKLDLFWASYEILKPAVYARAPVPAVAPLFRDSRLLQSTTAELLERAGISAFKRSNIDEVMKEVRDDLIFTNRGVMWLRYDTDDGQQVCIEHLDRTDFSHEPARKWAEVGWVARRAWMTKAEMRKRFVPHSKEAYKSAKFLTKRDDEANPDSQSLTKKAGVWEVWHKADGKVYWVTEGVDVLLDSGDPELKLSSFFPCPRPAYGTLRRRSLVPVPDWERYAIHFNKISVLTGRIYLLLEQVKLKGLIPAGGDIGSAVETLMRSDDDTILIPVPGASMLADGAASFVAWLPLKEIAEAIQGLIAARSQLIDDFYQLSGISDIMRGATESEETLGAQQLKSQYGSVRVRCKIDELQRVAADAVKIAAEILAEKFTQKNLLDMAQMELPAAKEIKDRIKEIEDAGQKELEALGKKAQEAAQQAQQSGEQVDPAQAQQAMQQAQQEIVAKYGPMLLEAQNQVPIDDVMKLLRDDRARSFAFEIESDSTILTDELQEKAQRSEFLQVFTTASAGLMQMAAMGEAGATLAGEMMKFALAPYRAGRQLDGAIDAFIDAAPEMAAAAQGTEGDDAGLAEANNKLAEAEKLKADAAMASVQARAAQAEADNQRKIGELQAKMASDAAKHEEQMEKLRQSAAANATNADKALAQVDLLKAQVIKTLTDAGIAVQRQNLDEFKSLQDIEFRATDQVIQQQDKQVDRAENAERHAVDDEFRERGEDRADQQAFAQEGQP